MFNCVIIINLLQLIKVHFLSPTMNHFGFLPSPPPPPPPSPLAAGAGVEDTPPPPSSCLSLTPREVVPVNAVSTASPVHLMQ